MIKTENCKNPKIINSLFLFKRHCGITLETLVCLHYYYNYTFFLIIFIFRFLDMTDMVDKIIVNGI